MPDNQTDATSSAPGTSSTSLDKPATVSGAKPEAATSDSKVPSLGISKSTPQPVADATEPKSGPAVAPVNTNNPKPVDDSKTSPQPDKKEPVDNFGGPEPSAQPAPAEPDEDKPEFDANEIAAALLAALEDAVESDQPFGIDESDIGENHHRFNSVRHYAGSTGGPMAIEDAKGKIHEAAQILADYLNG